jgi:diguanylate cyclase (GGDEF)-like protein
MKNGIKFAWLSLLLDIERYMMDERILVISDKKRDLGLFEEILGPKGFDIERISPLEEVEDTFLEDAFAAIVADHDLIGDRAYDWIGLLQENRSKSCFILYGEEIKADKVSEILQKGAYGFVPRALLSERIYDTIIGGLENRKAFVEILAMIDELRDVNRGLNREKAVLRAKNQELGFINRLSSKVAYDLNWDRIIPRIFSAGLLNVIDPEIFCILYQIGSMWNLAIHLSKNETDEETLEGLKRVIVNRFLTQSKQRISVKEIALHLYPSNVKVSSSSTISLSKPTICEPLSLAGRPLGMLLILPKQGQGFTKEKKELASTISNILAMSLKNAQEYHKLKEMTVRDGLTGIYNHKGFRDFMQMEFQRAKRHSKPLSLIMIDVDNFKAINDSLGHQAGDYVLRELTGCLKGSARSTDIVARYGGDEFAILLPETEMDKTEVLVKRVLRTIKNRSFEWGPKRIKVEISYGISTTSELEKGEDEEEFLHKADSRLYNAKWPRLYSVSTGT